MNLFLTLIFTYAWMECVTSYRGDVSWLLIEGLIVILCGTYWSIQDIKEVFGGVK